MINTTAKAGARLLFYSLLTATLLLPAYGFDDNDRGGRGRGCGLTLIGLTADRMLVTLKECDPRNARKLIGITGLTTDTGLVGIDFRVQDGKLYGVGDQGGVYQVDPATGAAVKVRQLTEALDGSSFGVDFNPAANALRIVSNSGQNLRQTFNDTTTATVRDGFLNYAGPQASGVTGAAYVNNDLAAETGTLLFDIDTTLNQLVLQVPPNSGGLTAVGQLTVDPETSVGFDIYSSLRNGVTQSNTGYATLTVGGVTSLYKINVLTGKATRLDTVRQAIIDVAVPVDQ